MRTILLINIILNLTIAYNFYGMKIIYPNQFEVDLQVLNEKELKEILETKNGKVHESLSKELTARTYSLSTKQIVIEFFDKSGVLVNDQNDYDHLKRVRFIKNKVEFLHPRISYYFRITENEADQLIKEYNGKHLKKYKSEFEEYFSFKVFQLSNNQVIIRYENDSYLYEDLEALAFYNNQITFIHYPNGADSGRDKFINGILSNQFNINNYHVYPNEADKIIQSHQLIPIQREIKFDRLINSILYQSPKGYFILMEDFNQINPRTNKKLGFGEATIFKTKEEFEKQYQEVLDWRERYDSDPELSQGVHIYKDLSDKYGKDFPNHTMEEINKLPAILNFDANKLEFSENCVSILTESIRWNFGDDEFFNQLIHPILAYIGEYQKSQGKGDWNMKLDREGKVWEPRFTNSDGQDVIDIIDLYKYFYEAEYGLPMVEHFIR